MDSHTWESIISCNSKERDIPSIVPRYIYPQYISARYLSTNVSTSMKRAVIYMKRCICGTRTRCEARQQIEKRGEKKKKPIRPRFGIYLKIEYPCSKNAIPPTFEIRVETFSSFSHRTTTVGHNFAHAITPFRLVLHLFFFIFYSRKSFVRSSLSSNKKKRRRERRGKEIKLNTSAWRRDDRLRTKETYYCDAR